MIQRITPLLTSKSLFDEMIWKWLPEEVIVTPVRYFDLISFLVTLGQSWVRLDAINSEIMDVLFCLFFSLSYSPPKSIIMLLFRVQFFSALVTRQRKKYSFLFSYPLSYTPSWVLFDDFFFDIHTILEYILSFRNMTKFNSSTREIKKRNRKRKEDRLNTTSTPSGKKKYKKTKYKLKMKQQTNQQHTYNTKKISKCKSRFLTTLPRWTWKKFSISHWNRRTYHLKTTIF